VCRKCASRKTGKTQIASRNSCKKNFLPEKQDINCQTKILFFSGLGFIFKHISDQFVYLQNVRAATFII